MTELAVTDGMPLPRDLPQGEFSTSLDSDGRLHIDHADPRILISAELLDMIADTPAPAAWLDFSGCRTYDGAVLRVNGINRKVIYRIVEYVPRVRGYVAEWPD